MKETLGTKQKILETAIELFSEKGFHGTSVRDIARATGLQVSSLYSHFTGKEDLLEAILVWYQQQVKQIRVPPERLDALIGTMPPKVLLMAGFVRLKAITGTSLMGQVIRILLTEMYRNPRVREFYLTWYFHENLEAARVVFQKMADRGLLRPCNPEALSRLYNALLNHCYLEYFLGKAGDADTSDLERRLETQLDEIFELLFEKGGTPC